MGRLKNGPFSGFTGRTGSLVGSRKNGKWIMAAVRATAPGTPSELQRNQQMKFGLMTGWLSRINSFLKVGYRKYDGEMSPFNAAVRYNLEKAVTGVAPVYTIDYPKVLLSNGALSPAYNLVMATTLDAQLDFSWEDNIGEFTGEDTDLAAFIVYNPTQEVFVMVVGPATRASGSFDMELPASFSTQNVHVYMAFVSANKKLVSTSQYLGATVVQ